MDKETLFLDLRNRYSNGLQSDKQFEDFFDVVSDLYELDLDSKEERELRLLECNANIQQTQLKLDSTLETDYKNQIYLRGKLISFYKDKEKLCKDDMEKMQARSTYLDLLKVHKEVISKYKNDKDTKIPIKEKLGLAIKDIAASMEIFMKEKDIFQKVKNIIRDTALGVTGAAIISLIIAAGGWYIFGIPFGLSDVVAMAPAAAYIGLSSLIRNISNKTVFQQFRYQNSDEFKALIQAFCDSHKEEFDVISKLNEARSNIVDREEKLNLNNQIIEKYNSLAKETSINGISQNFELQALGLLRDNKRIRESIKDDYEEELNDDREKYIQNNLELMKLNMLIFAKENSLKRAIKDAGNNFIKSANVILIAKAILSAVAPQAFAIRTLSDISTPLMIAAINAIVDIPTYNNKLKYKESEADKEENNNKKKRIIDLLESDDKALALT